MDSIGQISRHPHMFYRPDPVGKQPTKACGLSSLSQLEAVSVFQSQEADLTIITQDGDYVTISSDSESRLTYATYDQAVRMRGMRSRLHSEAFSLENHQEFFMSVQGELDDQELKDVQKVLQSIDKIMDDLLSGHLDQGMTRTAKLGDLDSLSKVEATLQVEQSLFWGSAIRTQTVSTPNPSNKPPETIGDPVGPNILDAVRQRILDNLRDRDLSPNKMSKIIEKFLLKLSRALPENENHRLTDDSIINQLKSNLLKEISVFH